jgi:hypothetical protein
MPPLRETHRGQVAGVRRESLTDVIRAFQDRSIIDYHGGTIHVKDVGALEAQSCECYALIRDEYAMVFVP